MIHIRQAREDAQRLLTAQIGEGKPIERAVIIDDLFGRIRVLLWLAPSAPKDFVYEFDKSFRESLGDFWAGFWVATRSERSRRQDVRRALGSVD